MSEVVKVRDLEVHYRRKGFRAGSLRAVDGVSFDIADGETVGLVGESGSGKSTIGRALLGLAPVSAGTVDFQGEVSSPRARAQQLQAIFQDPYSTLNPLRTIGQTLREPLQVQRVPADEADQRIASVLERVGLPATAQSRLPHEFSGGQRQRISIARALVVSPRLVVCDEPISALDLSTQASVLNLLKELQDTLDVGYLFVAHDLVAVQHLSHRVLVLYRGRVMESGPADEVCGSPHHPYSIALWAAAPVPDPQQQRRRRELRAAVGATGSAATAPTTGIGHCPFAARCAFADEVCWEARPKKVSVGPRELECHLYDGASGHRDAGRGLDVITAASVAR